MSDEVPTSAKAGSAHRVAGGVLMGLAALISWIAPLPVLHDHTNEYRYAHEWDLLIVPAFSIAATVLFFAGLALFRRWGRWRALAWMLASPVIGWVLSLAILALGHWLNPLPPLLDT